jgi:hypothetical protein
LCIKAVEVSCDSPFNPIHFLGYNLVDNREAGAPVKALYDYEAVEVSCDNLFYQIHVQDTSWWITERLVFLGSLGCKCS